MNKVIKETTKPNKNVRASKMQQTPKSKVKPAKTDGLKQLLPPLKRFVEISSQATLRPLTLSLLNSTNTQENLYEAFKENNPSLSVVKLPLIPEKNICSLSQGQIGLLKIKKSGKMIATIGNINYELIPNKTQEFEEELVAIKDKSLMVLGSIDNQFDLVPEYQTIFNFN